MPTPNLAGLTSITPVLVSSQLANGDNTVYTVPANKAAKLASLVLTNVSAAAVTISAAVVPSGGAIDGTHRIISALALAAGDSLPVEDVAGMFLPTGAVLAVTVSAGASVDAVLTLLELA